MVARALLGANKICSQSPSSLANPADESCRHARHEGEAWDVAGYNCPGGNEAELPEGMSADDGGVGTDRGSALDERPGKLGLTLDGCARIVDIRENTAWPAEDLILQLDPIVEADVILNFATVADPYRGADHHVLANGAIFANLALPENVHEMPDARAFADFTRLVNVGAFVDLRAWKSIGLRRHRRLRAPVLTQVVPTIKTKILLSASRVNIF